MIDLTNEFGRRADQRLRDEDVIWLTTVTPDGVAQPNPIWFYWNGESIILYSQPGSYRIRNIQQNRMVALNLQGAGVLGDNVVVITGEASLKFDYQQVDPGYETKYEKYLPEMSLTYQQLKEEYSVEITVHPTRLRGN
jgi:PPOX class probable F420-dependent enzyme